MRSSIISIFIILLLAMAVSLQNHPIMAQEAGGPKLFIKQTRFEFPPVFEGESVQYEFKVENGGTGALAIIDVETD